MLLITHGSYASAMTQPSARVARTVNQAAEEVKARLFAPDPVQFFFILTRVAQEVKENKDMKPALRQVYKDLLKGMGGIIIIGRKPGEEDVKVSDLLQDNKKYSITLVANRVYAHIIKPDTPKEVKDKLSAKIREKWPQDQGPQFDNDKLNRIIREKAVWTAFNGLIKCDDEYALKEVALRLLCAIPGATDPSLKLLRFRRDLSLSDNTLEEMRRIVEGIRDNLSIIAALAEMIKDLESIGKFKERFDRTIEEILEEPRSETPAVTEKQPRRMTLPAIAGAAAAPPSQGGQTTGTAPSAEQRPPSRKGTLPPLQGGPKLPEAPETDAAASSVTKSERQGLGKTLPPLNGAAISGAGPGVDQPTNTSTGQGAAASGSSSGMSKLDQLVTSPQNPETDFPFEIQVALPPMKSQRSDLVPSRKDLKTYRKIEAPVRTILGKIRKNLEINDLTKHPEKLKEALRIIATGQVGDAKIDLTDGAKLYLRRLVGLFLGLIPTDTLDASSKNELKQLKDDLESDKDPFNIAESLLEADALIGAMAKQLETPGIAREFTSDCQLDLTVDPRKIAKYIENNIEKIDKIIGNIFNVLKSHRYNAYSESPCIRMMRLLLEVVGKAHLSLKNVMDETDIEVAIQWIQDGVTKARERQKLLDGLRELEEAIKAIPDELKKPEKRQKLLDGLKEISDLCELRRTFRQDFLDMEVHGQIGYVLLDENDNPTEYGFNISGRTDSNKVTRFKMPRDDQAALVLAGHLVRGTAGKIVGKEITNPSFTFGRQDIESYSYGKWSEGKRYKVVTALFEESKLPKILPWERGKIIELPETGSTQAATAPAASSSTPPAATATVTPLYTTPPGSDNTTNAPEEGVFNAIDLPVYIISGTELGSVRVRPDELAKKKRGQLLTRAELREMIVGEIPSWLSLEYKLVVGQGSTHLTAVKVTDKPKFTDPLVAKGRNFAVTGASGSNITAPSNLAEMKALAVENPDLLGVQVAPFGMTICTGRISLSIFWNKSLMVEWFQSSSSLLELLQILEENSCQIYSLSYNVNKRRGREEDVTEIDQKIKNVIRDTLSLPTKPDLPRGSSLKVNPEPQKLLELIIKLDVAIN